MPSDLTSRASLSLSLFLFSGASNRDPCCFWCIAQSHPACKQWDKKIQCLRFCPCVQPPGLQKGFKSIKASGWISVYAVLFLLIDCQEQLPPSVEPRRQKVLKSSKFGFTAKLGWPSKVGVIQGSKFWTLTVLLVKRLVKKGHEDAASVLKRVTRKEVMHCSGVRHILLWLRLLVQLILMTVPSCKIQWQWQLQSKSSNNWTLWCWH